MAKKTATYANYELRVEDNGKIVILNDGQLMQNTMGAIRSIASEVSFALDPKWNTQSSGRKLIDFLNSSGSATTPVSAPIPKSDAKPTLSTASKPVTKPAQTKNDNDLTEEEMNELLKQIAELRKTIEALESRIAKLESNRGANTNVTTDREVIIAHKKVTAGGRDNDYYKTSKNRILIDCSPRYSFREANYRKALINALISIGDNMEPKPNESIETFVARIRAKYNPDPSLPTLLGGFVLMQSGSLWTVTPTNRSIKF